MNEIIARLYEIVALMEAIGDPAVHGNDGFSQDGLGREQLLDMYSIEFGVLSEQLRDEHGIGIQFELTD